MYLTPAPQNTLQAAKAEDKLMMEKLLDAITLEVRFHSQVGPISLPIFCREKHACGQLLCLPVAVGAFGFYLRFPLATTTTTSTTPAQAEMDVLYPLMAKKLKDGNAIEKASFLFLLSYFIKIAGRCSIRVDVLCPLMAKSSRMARPSRWQACSVLLHH